MPDIQWNNSALTTLQQCGEKFRRPSCSTRRAGMPQDYVVGPALVCSRRELQ